MNKTLVKLIAVAVTSMALSYSAIADDTNSVVSSTTSNQAIQKAVVGLVNECVSNYTNLYFETHMMYAPKLADRWGGGFGVYYPLSTYVIAGSRVDWVNGGFWMPQGNVTLDLPFVPFKQFPTFVVTPLAFGGVGVPLAVKRSGQATAIVGTGAEVNFYESPDKKWKVGAAFDIERWSGFAGDQYRGGIVAHYKF